jgi:hypothetical protein
MFLYMCTLSNDEIRLNSIAATLNINQKIFCENIQSPHTIYETCFIVKYSHPPVQQRTKSYSLFPTLTLDPCLISFHLSLPPPSSACDNYCSTHLFETNLDSICE